MKKIETGLKGLVAIQPDIYQDERGYFFESYQKEKYERLGIHDDFIQDNEAFSVKNTLRGLHYQLPPYSQSKLVRVTIGSVLDVAVDIRIDSPTYGHYYSILLTGENKSQLYIPHGFAHGYVVLSEYAVFQYKTDNHYSKEHEAGIHYADKTIGIDWKIESTGLIISEKDLKLPTFGSHKKM
jgi:dTDP-4-dehydrorhamnose 3,5-epimerase